MKVGWTTVFKKPRTVEILADVDRGEPGTAAQWYKRISTPAASQGLNDVFSLTLRVALLF